MSLDNVTKVRKGKNLKTIIEDEYHTSEFSETDNLDTKTLTEARDFYERVFITVRESLENNEQCPITKRKRKRATRKNRNAPKKA